MATAATGATSPVVKPDAMPTAEASEDLIEEDMGIPDGYDDIPDIPDLKMESDDDLLSYTFNDAEDVDTDSPADQAPPDKRQRTASLSARGVQGERSTVVARTRLKPIRTNCR